ncbi:MAG: NAD(P)/FAD-dependent oxidoreductase [Candidatus Thermoplasmatota archaeon]
MVKEKKVLVVGAGPAGVSAAYFLKKLDRDNRFIVELVDRLPSDKYRIYHDMCGECVNKELFNEMKPLKPEGIVEEICLTREYWPGGICIESRMDGYLIDRSLFLESIIDAFVKEGGVFRIRRVTGVSLGGKTVKVGFDDAYRRYDYVVGADGATSLIRRYLGLTGKTRLFYQYIVRKKPDHGVLELHYDERYRGDYLWVFPHGDDTKIGYPADTPPDKNMFKKDDIMVRQARCICYGGIDRYVVGNILLVGDAAGHTNPVTKGGIRPGMNAGRLAAVAILKGDPLLYERRWRVSPFADPVFSQAFQVLEGMSNYELERHIEPFREGYGLLSYLKGLLFYRRYRVLYRAYVSSNRYGW